MSRSAAAVVVSFLCIAGAQAQEIELSGYYKNLLAASRTVAPEGDRYTLDLNRLRLELKGAVAQGLSLDVQYDNEVLVGDYVRTDQFALMRDRRPDQYWDLDDDHARGRSYHAGQRLYRASATLSAGDTDVRIGRQRIAWGTGRFWSPVDILNPLNPIALEREERLGVDAVLAEHKLGPLSRISAVYAPRRENGESSAALNWHANAAGLDYSLIGGRFRGERVVGADIATQWGSAGIRGEITFNEPRAGQAYRRALVAADYAFANTLNMSGELYYNGAGATERAFYDFSSLFAGRIQNVGRRYFGGFASYELTPLLKSVNYLVVNLADRSRFFSPALIFSVQENVDFTVGAQLFGGSEGSEYARLNDVLFAQLQWFF